MIKERPRIRCDGVYICKMHYVRYGVSDEYNQRPVHDVITYKYLRFYRNGNMMSVYTNKPPKKFVPMFYE